MKQSTPSGAGKASEAGYTALGQLVAEVAHEARNPLASILAGLEAWEQEPLAGFEVFGPRIRREAGRLCQLMDSVLEMARPARGAGTTVSLNHLVEDAVASAELGLDREGPRIETELPSEPLLLQGNSAALGSMVRNLLDNALQHSPTGTAVRVSAGRLEQDILVRVEDRGPGLTPLELERAFEPFFSRRPGGVGLGLAIVEKIVSEHGGVVVIYNRAGGGAVVEVNLPSRTPAE